MACVNGESKILEAGYVFSTSNYFISLAQQFKNWTQACKIHDICKILGIVTIIIL